MNKPKIVMGFIYDEEKGYLTLEEYNKQIRAEVIDEIMELKGKHCDSCSMQNICGNDCLKNILEGLKEKK